MCTLFVRSIGKSSSATAHCVFNYIITIMEYRAAICCIYCARARSADEARDCHMICVVVTQS